MVQAHQVSIKKAQAHAWAFFMRLEEPLNVAPYGLEVSASGANRLFAPPQAATKRSPSTN